ncbi:hypothetical protein O7632_23570 [Solwaraspora sp. WMMD406]|uniref:hypothetical protein n=1 Tax=Solwaraspora sp. WMMD406 TaxID=3016095 RepID=UPI00241810B4|nr:hypothetical protein [Solwaraspora sp. WMMD406]MDG4767053.1 hypothetical protein [Solwaraspora sp. WMMD406]
MRAGESEIVALLVSDQQQAREVGGCRQDGGRPDIGLVATVGGEQVGQADDVSRATRRQW